MRRLPPFAARIAWDVRRFMRDSLGLSPPWPCCVAAVSGGADSTALLYLLQALEVPLVVAHLDHGLRPESGEEARHVAGLAASLGLACVTERRDVAGLARERGLGLEDAGRQCRYALLERVRREYGAEWIVLGHHLDDLSEDMLLRLIRGSGWPALAGMTARDDARRLLRPLLHTRREDLESCLREMGLSWCDDASNRERHARRNRIRLDILPRIREENPAFGENVRRLWLLAREDERFWNILLAPHAAPPEAGGTVLLEACRLDGLPPAARLRLYLESVRRVRAVSGAGQARLEALLRLERLWQARRTGSVIQMPGVSARIGREGIRFSPTPQTA